MASHTRVRFPALTPIEKGAGDGFAQAFGDVVLAGGFLGDAVGGWIVGGDSGDFDGGVAGALALRFCRKGKGDEQGD